MKKIIIVALLLTASLYAYAGNVNYYGIVTRVAFIDDNGSFVVTVDSNALDDCQYKYAYFKVNKVGQKRVEMAYSMALTSMTSKLTMNFVIDKDINGVGGVCEVAGMAAGIQSY